MSTMYTDKPGEKVRAEDPPETPAEDLLVDEHVRVAKWATPEEIEAALDEAASLKAVVSAADYEYAIDVAKRLASGKKAVEAFYKPLKQRMDRLKSYILGAEDEDADRLEVERNRVAKLAAEWHAAETAREAKAKAEAERVAREKAEADRKAQVERLQRAAESVPDTAVANAIRTEANALAEEKIATPKPDFVSAIPAVKGFVPSRVTYTARCDDLLALVKAVAEGKVPLDAIQANQTRLNAAAVDQREALDWPGVVVLKSGAPVVRG